MHHALRMHHHINHVRGHIKQPAGFDKFQPLVHQGGRIHRDLRAHVPVGMFHRLFRRHSLEFFNTEFTERATGSSEQQPLHAGIDALLGEALKNRVMLGIQWQQRGPMTLHRIHEQ